MFTFKEGDEGLQAIATRMNEWMTANGHDVEARLYGLRADRRQTFSIHRDWVNAGAMNFIASATGFTFYSPIESEHPNNIGVRYGERKNPETLETVIKALKFLVKAKLGLVVSDL